MYCVTGVVDPKLFIPDPDSALNFLSSGSGQKFRIHADPDPTHVILSIFRNCKKTHLKINHKEEFINYLQFYISYYSPTVLKVQDSKRNDIFIHLLVHILLDPDPKQ